jgi:hypothetical protein
LKGIDVGPLVVYHSVVKSYVLPGADGTMSQVGRRADAKAAGRPRGREIALRFYADGGREVDEATFAARFAEVLGAPEYRVRPTAADEAWLAGYRQGVREGA